MIGHRVVREWNPGVGDDRTWHETLDASGNVRQVRPQTGGARTHYRFDDAGDLDQEDGADGTVRKSLPYPGGVDPMDEPGIYLHVDDDFSPPVIRWTSSQSMARPARCPTEAAWKIGSRE